jgi:dolichyl-phosphate-mannose--protein O-mannosyl transferase
MLYMMLTRMDTVQESLWIMLQGMLGIFIFTGIFYLLIYSLEKIFTARKKP